MSRLGKQLAYVLRHNPQSIGVSLDAEGWAEVGPILAGLKVSQEELERVVAEDSKGRFTLRDGRIRANQGHSIEVHAVDLTPRSPPAVLYHGTTETRWVLMQQSGGLQRMQRHHVHLSADPTSACEVGARHRREKLLLLQVDAAAMVQDGHVFCCSDNGVWLTDTVPLKYLRH